MKLWKCYGFDWWENYDDHTPGEKSYTVKKKKKKVNMDVKQRYFTENRSLDNRITADYTNLLR